MRQRHVANPSCPGTGLGTLTAMRREHLQGQQRAKAAAANAAFAATLRKQG